MKYIHKTAFTYNLANTKSTLLYFSRDLNFLKNLPMRPFLCSLLKCDKCNACESFRLVPKEIEKVAVPSCLPKIADFKNRTDFLSALVEEVHRTGRAVIDLEEADIQLFLETENFDSPEHLKIVELLYGIEVVTGTVFCVQCGTVKEIKNKILLFS